MAGGMKITFFGSQIGNYIFPQVIKVMPYSVIVVEGPLVVGLIQVPVLVAAANTCYLVTLKNTSAVGTAIRIGTAPSFAAGALSGFLLNPNEGLVWDFTGIGLNAIANVAGGQLEAFILATP